MLILHSLLLRIHFLQILLDSTTCRRLERVHCLLTTTTTSFITSNAPPIATNTSFCYFAGILLLLLLLLQLPLLLHALLLLLPPILLCYFIDYYDSFNQAPQRGAFVLLLVLHYK